MLHNERVTNEAIQSEAVRQTRRRCAEHGVVLLVGDLTELVPRCVEVPTRLWELTFLACTRGGEVLGLAAQDWANEAKVSAGETREDRRDRWRRSLWWAESAESVRVPTRALVVADREADDFQMYHACRRAGHGFVIRAQHDRALAGEPGRLWERLEREPACGEVELSVPARRAVTAGPPPSQRSARAARVARLEVKYASVSFKPPAGDSRFDAPLDVNVVWVREREAPAGVDPVHWVLVTNEPVGDLESALRVVNDYRCRWVIEEYHKAQKTGCRLEQTQIKDRAAFERLAALTGVIATRLLRLRDAADDDDRRHRPAAQTLADAFDPMWFAVVAQLAKVNRADLTTDQFFKTIARHGGHLGRKHDPRPGWQALWHGYQYIAALVTGALLARQIE